MTLSGTLDAGAVLVVHHASWAAGPLPAGSIANSAVINFNGDDALVLARGGTTVDQFGQVGFDPGTAWDLSLEWDGFPIDTADGLGVR